MVSSRKPTGFTGELYGPIDNKKMRRLETVSSPAKMPKKQLPELDGPGAFRVHLGEVGVPFSGYTIVADYSTHLANKV
jgi:hypothetical protein